MKEFSLNCTQMTTREESHKYMKEIFSFPEWYGENLDGLYDCLSDLAPERIILENSTALDALGEWKNALLDTLRDCCEVIFM